MWKAVYCGVRIAFHSELNVDSKKIFNSTFESVFKVKNVDSSYGSPNFFYFRFQGFDESQIKTIKSDNIGLFFEQSKKQQIDLSLIEGSEGTIELVNLNARSCLMNILNHPIKTLNRDSKLELSQKNEQTINTFELNNVLKISERKLSNNLIEETVKETPKRTPYIVTEKLKSNILDLLKLLSFDEHLPILLEGPTSTGKTSVVMFLAELVGQKVLRVNNHKDTDLEEYIGKYVPSVDKGGLVFQYGVLVRAMRSGSWLLLDELNLAKSDILEALNR